MDGSACERIPRESGDSEVMYARMVHAVERRLPGGDSARFPLRSGRSEKLIARASRTVCGRR